MPSNQNSQFNTILCIWIGYTYMIQLTFSTAKDLNCTVAALRKLQ